MNQPRYSYAHRGNLWAVLKWKYMPNGSTAEVVKYFQTKIEAVQMTDNLNQQAEEE